MRVSMRDVADHAGVAISCVSWVLNNHPRASEIRGETRERILDSAHELGYRRSKSAVTMRTGFDATTIALLGSTGKIDSGIPSSVIQNFMQSGFGLRIFIVEDLKKTLLEIQDSQIRYIYSCMQQGELRNQLAEFCYQNHLLCFFTGEGAVPYNFPVCAPESQLEMKFLMNKLLERGHRRIGLLCGNHNIICNHIRHQAYEATLRDAGIEPDPVLKYCHDVTRVDFLHYLEQSQPTALVGVDGVQAHLAMNVLIRHQIRIPDEISVMAITGSKVLPFMIEMSRVEERITPSCTAALQYFKTGTVPEMGMEKQNFIFHPGETLATVPVHPRYFQKLADRDIFYRQEKREK